MTLWPDANHLNRLLDLIFLFITGLEFPLIHDGSFRFWPALSDCELLPWDDWESFLCITGGLFLESFLCNIGVLFLESFLCNIRVLFFESFLCNTGVLLAVILSASLPCIVSKCSSDVFPLLEYWNSESLSLEGDGEVCWEEVNDFDFIGDCELLMAQGVVGMIFADELSSSSSVEKSAGSSYKTNSILE